ncbi:hypothetical protein [Parafilimonas sp.]|uniref:hypothetical protein n=1 Tax=Parafilimonas sp. TaxID=1969739 RepID=UPI0039E404D5
MLTAYDKNSFGTLIHLKIIFYETQIFNARYPACPGNYVCAKRKKRLVFNSGIGYGSYELDIKAYAGNYADQKFTQPVIWLGAEKKSILNKNGFVLDAGGGLAGSFKLKTKSTLSGPENVENNKGWSLGIHGLAKAGYELGGKNSSIVPLIGLGPYFIDLYNGAANDEDAFGNWIYGLQGYAGVEFSLNTIAVIPHINFGIADWGNSGRELHGEGDNYQNGQPSMFEAGISVALRL